VAIGMSVAALAAFEAWYLLVSVRSQPGIPSLRIEKA
jgi:hypothetical protein